MFWQIAAFTNLLLDRKMFVRQKWTFWCSCCCPDKFRNVKWENIKPIWIMDSVAVRIPFGMVTAIGWVPKATNLLTHLSAPSGMVSGQFFLIQWDGFFYEGVTKEIWNMIWINKFFGYFEINSSRYEIMASVAAWLPFARAAAIGWVPIAVNPIPPPSVLQVSVRILYNQKFFIGNICLIFNGLQGPTKGEWWKANHQCIWKKVWDVAYHIREVSRHIVRIQRERIFPRWGNRRILFWQGPRNFQTYP